MIVGFDVNRLHTRAWVDTQNSHTAAVGRDLLVACAWEMNDEGRAGGSAVRVGGEDIYLVLNVGDKGATLGHRGDEQ